MPQQATQSGDRLLWLAAATIALMAIVWLAIAAPWSAPQEFDEMAAVNASSDAPATTGAASALPTVRDAAAGVDALPSDPLSLARLALEAGMLVEPARYSAWTLFGEAAALDPGNPAASDGLEQVAAALLLRGRAALEQGRYDDASAIAETIFYRLPEHEGAQNLVAELIAATAPPEPVIPAVPEIEVEAPIAETLPPIDPIPELHAAFLDAMARNAVLTPPGASARDVVIEMLATAPGHEMSRFARDMLVTELLDRSEQSIQARDSAAAQAWIDAAAPLATDPRRFASAEERLLLYLIDAQSQRRLPVSELKRIHHVAPDYPTTALNRNVEGWVDLEFVVTPEGETESITVVEASHEHYFRAEAQAAVDQWRFEPVIFKDRAIAQRSFARLEFVID